MLRKLISPRHKCSIRHAGGLVQTAFEVKSLAGANLPKSEFSGSLSHRADATRFHPERIGDFSSNEITSGDESFSVRIDPMRSFPHTGQEDKGLNGFFVSHPAARSHSKIGAYSKPFLRWSEVKRNAR
jgi:hypothetical protein